MFRQQTSSALENTPAISEKALKITLYDYMFRAVRSAETTVGSNVTFNTSDLTAGMYYLHVSDGSNTDMQQVLIQH
ncbi:MAG TPA: T9SS type A sorting domain-containing protein [Anseongella sp.]